MANLISTLLKDNSYLNNSSIFIPHLTSLEKKVSCLRSRIYSGLEKITAGELETEITEIKNDLESVGYILSDFEEIFKKSTVRDRIHLEIISHNEKVARLNEEREKLKSSLELRKYTYYMTTSEEDRTLIKHEILKLKQQIAERSGKIEGLNSELEKIRVGLVNLGSASLEKFESCFKKLNSKLKNLTEVQDKVEKLWRDRIREGKVNLKGDLYIHTFHGKVSALSTSRWLFKF